MKKRGMRAIIIMMSVLGTGVGLYKTYTYTFSMRGCTIQIDSLLAQPYQEKIAEYLAQHSELYNEPLSNICEHLRTQYPFISAIQAHRCASGQLELELSTVTPVFKINETKILAHTGDLYDHALFEPATIAHLDHIAVTHEEDMHAVYQACSKHLSTALCSRYQVTWKNSREITLRDKEHQQFSCICDAATIPDQEMLALLDQVRLDVCSHNAHTRTKNWIADMRFSKQIVVHSEQGGYRG